MSSATSSAATQTNPGWGLDRIDQSALPLNGSFTTTSDGAGVNIYVIDGGLEVGHPDFGGRASIVYDAFDKTGLSGTPTDDHATAMAGIAAGATYGVARQAKILGVKTYNTPHAAPDPVEFMNAVKWVTEDAKKRGPSVAVISSNWVDYTISTGLEDAVNALANSGVFVAVSAGNIIDGDDAGSSNWNACANTPANAIGPLVVGASDQTDHVVRHSSFTTPSGETAVWSSAYGGCVDLFAPGQNVLTTGLGGVIGYRVAGTSHAAPYAAGAAALYKAKFGQAPSSTVKSWLVQHASPAIIDPPQFWLYGTTPNKLLNISGL
ncbi:hypothetical protein JMUB6875_76590 [Nocardia sp. JMUB6875]